MLLSEHRTHSHLSQVPVENLFTLTFSVQIQKYTAVLDTKIARETAAEACQRFCEGEPQIFRAVPDAKRHKAVKFSRLAF